MDVQHFVKKCLSKEVLCPYPSPNSGEMGSKSIYRGPTNIFRNRSQNNVDRIKDGQVVFDEVPFEEVFIVLWCMKKTVQLSDISLTSKPWMEARSLVHEELYTA